MFNLVIALRYTRLPLTKQDIQRTVGGYDPHAGDIAFDKMFERDKSDLREIGVPIEVGPVSKMNPETGYRIRNNDYSMGDITFDPQEAAAVAVAAAMWQSKEMSSAAQAAVHKLRANGIAVVEPSSPAGPPADRGAEATLRALLTGIDQHQQVSFEYRPNPTVDFTVRTLHPWGVVTVRSARYVVGHDVDRGAVRTFKLNRLRGGEVLAAAADVRPPEGFDLRAHAAAAASTTGTEPSGTARVWVAEGRGEGLRRMATGTVVGGFRGRAGHELTVDMRSRRQLTRAIASLGPDAVVLEPVPLRDAVIAALRGAVVADGAIDAAEGAR
jgi:proteasome accessory factor B